MEKEVPVSCIDAYEVPRYGKMVLVQPGGVLLPAGYKKFAKPIYNFKYRSDDICLFTYPKSGTTWTAEIVWAMTHINEMQRALTENLNHRYFFIDNDFFHDLAEKEYMEKLKAKCPYAKQEDGPILQLTALEKERRFIWSHLSFDLQNPDVLDKCKVVYVIRHPKDNMFSRFMHFNKVANASLPIIFETFLSDNTPYGNYWHHVSEAWKRRDHPNLHIMFYEDMKADIMAELKRLDKFLGTNLTDEQLKKVSEHTSFDNMKANPSMVLDIAGFKGSFFYKGQVGSSKGQLPPELDARMDAWIKENAAKVDPAFKYAS